MSVIQPLLAVLLAALLLPAGGEGEVERSGDVSQEGLLDLENARAAYGRESRGLDEDFKAKLVALGDRHRQIADLKKEAAARKGDLALALAWEELAKELGPEPPAPDGKKLAEEIPKDVEKARAEHRKDRSDLEGEILQKRRALRERLLKAVVEEKAAATRRGDLKMAQGWQDFEVELRPKPVNLAPKARVTANSKYDGRDPAEMMNDGDVSVSVSDRKFWLSGAVGQKPDWARFELATVRPVRKVRMLTPLARKWHQHGHEPLDYDVTLKVGGKVKSKVSVRGGEHPKVEPGKNGKTQWIEIDFKSEIDASEVEFRCHKTSGRNFGPVVFEFEILGEE